MDEITQKITAYVGDLAERRGLVWECHGVETSLVGSEVIDSFSLVEMVEFLESEFEVIFTDEDLVSDCMATVGGTADLIRQKLQSCA
jgi:acyl carrier protein